MPCGAICPALDRVEEILTLDEEDLETGASAWKDLEKEGIRASDAVLCFSPEKKLALQDPLDIPAGRISALCGASGCGKTSFIKTLIGFYPYEGDISIAGAPLNAYSKKYLREQIAYLSQQNILIAGSIKENLLIGGHAAVTEEEMKEALRICTCDEWLGDMPDGLDTILDEGGLRLSGGQRQMLIIAVRCSRRSLFSSWMRRSPPSTRSVPCGSSRISAGRTPKRRFCSSAMKRRSFDAAMSRSW